MAYINKIGRRAKLQGTFLFVMLLVSWSSAFGHGHGDEKHMLKSEPQNVDVKLKEKLEKINSNYLARVKPIFKAKCIDCHGSGNPFPWYYNLPIAKQIMNHDIEEAKEHLDMSFDFPFKGHGNIVKDLSEIKEVVEEGEMPPLKYKVFHWKSGLTTEDSKIIIEWVEESLGMLQAGP